MQMRIISIGKALLMVVIAVGTLTVYACDNERSDKLHDKQNDELYEPSDSLKEKLIMIPEDSLKRIIEGGNINCDSAKDENLCDVKGFIEFLDGNMEITFYYLWKIIDDLQEISILWIEGERVDTINMWEMLWEIREKIKKERSIMVDRIERIEDNGFKIYVGRREEE